MPKKKKKPEMIRLYFDEGESGWAELVSKHPVRARIANIPFGGKFNINDLVTLKRLPQGGIAADRIIERVYPVRVGVWYDEESQFKKLVDAIHRRGGKAEGAIGPREGHQGAVTFATTSEDDVLAVLEEVGLEDRQPKGWQPNDITEDPRDWSPRE